MNVLSKFGVEKYKIQGEWEIKANYTLMRKFIFTIFHF
mgnify:CR=1 FL=1